MLRGSSRYLPVQDPELETDPSERKCPSSANTYDPHSARTPDILKEIHISDHVIQCKEARFPHKWVLCGPG